MDFMVKNNWGKPDAMLTMSAIAMAVILLKILVNGLVITVGGAAVVTCGTIDGTVIGALLTPTLGAYVAHRYTEHKFPMDINGNGKIDPEEEIKKEG